MAAGKVVTIIQARIGSARLPGKVLEDIGGQSMLERVVGRATQIGYPVCLAVAREENGLAPICAINGWTFGKGDEHDVLGRYLETARSLDAAHVVRVTADCPFLDVEAAKWTVQHHLETGADFTHYVAEGRGVEVFTRHALEDSAKLAPRGVRFFREHPDEWILHNPRRYHIERLKFSVDTPEDLELARRRAMAKDDGLKATLGKVPPNRGRNLPGPAFDGSHSKEGSTGNPGLELPWDGSDATDKPGELPPLKHL